MTALPPHQLQARLADYLSAQTHAPVQVHNAQPLAGGASRDSWAFNATFGDGTSERFVLRRDLPTRMNEQALTRAQEFALMRAAYDHGVLVARVRWLCEDERVLDLPFFIMDYVEGVSVGRKLMTSPDLIAARAALPSQMAQQLARIHTLDASGLVFLPRPLKNHPARHAVQETYATLDSINAVVPALEYALRWCERYAPAPDRLTFIHGDFRVGNLLVNPAGLAAVIDWEFSHIGDPCEELGYLCMRDWRFGADKLRAAGLSPREPFIRAYEQHAGVTVNPEAVTWWEILGNIRWAVICLVQAQRHLSNQDPSIELASLGRRSIEMQAEALRLIRQSDLNGVSTI